MKTTAVGTVVIASPVLSILGIVFIILKLCDVIAWSWVWVLAPFWGPLVLFGAILFTIFIGALVFSFFDRR